MLAIFSRQMGHFVDVDMIDWQPPIARVAAINVAEWGIVVEEALAQGKPK